MAESQIIIWDEATSNLDSESEALIQTALAELREGRIVFVIAHRLSTVTHADIILVMEGGRLVERGTHGDLMRSGGTYWDMMNRQGMWSRQWGFPGGRSMSAWWGSNRDRADFGAKGQRRVATNRLLCNGQPNAALAEFIRVGHEWLMPPISTRISYCRLSVENGRVRESNRTRNANSGMDLVLKTAECFLAFSRFEIDRRVPWAPAVPEFH